jgi:hypothetical protein
MTDTLNAAEPRRWAMRCMTRADAADCDDEERARLLRMREGLLALADNADWLDGRHTDPKLQAVAAE